MSTYALTDSATMLRRDLRHLRRYPVMTISTVLTPTAMLLLFVYFFGGAMSSGFRGAGASCVDYIVPGKSVCQSMQSSAVVDESKPPSYGHK